MEDYPLFRVLAEHHCQSIPFLQVISTPWLRPLDELTSTEPNRTKLGTKRYGTVLQKFAHIAVVIVTGVQYFNFIMTATVRHA